MKEFNDKLLNWVRTSPSKDAGVNNIQIPGQVEHLVWQNRSQVPSAYERDLIQHLLQAFSQGITELNDLVERLNQNGFSNMNGEQWSVAIFSMEMQRLGY